LRRVAGGICGARKEKVAGGYKNDAVRLLQCDAVS
jgi:hypothetical protein